MLPLRSFQHRVFAVLLLMAVIPASLAVGAGALALREVGSAVGTLGPWDAVAGSGRELAEAARRAAPGDSAVAVAAREHRENLSASVRQSRLWSLVAARTMELLPLLALGAVLVLGLVALLAARWLSGSLARPIGELVGWTGHIARGEPLPPPSTDREAGVREFGLLRQALRSMAGELAEARRREVDATRLRAWTEMARRVAHELKNPLTPMRMAAGSLQRVDDERVGESAGILMEEIGRLEVMARTFSQFGRMPEGPPSEVDLRELAESVAAGYRASDVPVRVVCERGAPRVRGHHDLLHRAVQNLVVNAVEATRGAAGGAAGGAGAGAGGGAGGPEGGPAGRHRELPGVEIVVGPASGGARIAVRDRGPGIAEEILETLWFPDVTTKSRGTGLGLAMVRQAADAHGGEALARNRPGGGAELELVLPATSPTSPGAPPPDSGA